MIDHLKFSIDDQNRLVRKRVIAELAPAMMHGAWGSMLLPPASILEAQREYMAEVNEANRDVLISYQRMETRTNRT
jgi:hypothetical protein